MSLWFMLRIIFKELKYKEEAAAAVAATLVAKKGNS